jgi:hypothetical protein
MGAVMTGSTLEHAQAGNPATALPPAAVALAHRLHILGSPVIGNQPQGNAGPWLIWARPNLQRARRILSVGPLGAQAQFDYFDVAAPRQRAAAQGRALPPSEAIHIAQAWLRQVGAVVPHVRTSVIRTNGTFIGGTGLCCWSENLDHVVFGGRRDIYGLPVGAAAQIYVAASRRVVQANVNPQGGYRYPGRPRCVDRTHPDSRGVPIGPRCFSYPAMTATMWPVDIGGHQPYLVGPGWFSVEAAVAAKLTPLPDPRRLHLVFSSGSRVVYTASKGRITYRFTQVSAFPGFRFSVWPLVDVERIR